VLYSARRLSLKNRPCQVASVLALRKNGMRHSAMPNVSTRVFTTSPHSSQLGIRSSEARTSAMRRSRLAPFLLRRELEGEIQSQRVYEKG